MPLATIGYQGVTLDSVVRALLQAGVQHLIDVRAVPRSRKPGFSKRQLEAALGEAGLRYTHLRSLGTPPDGRLAARRGDTGTMQRIFRDHMRDDAAQAELSLARTMAAAATCCLLCFEREAARCHRRLVAEMMTPDPARDLMPEF